MHVVQCKIVLLLLLAFTGTGIIMSFALVPTVAKGAEHKLNQNTKHTINIITNTVQYIYIYICVCVFVYKIHCVSNANSSYSNIT